MIFLLKLMLAHIIGDFFLQPQNWVQNKEAKKIKSPYLYLHVAIHFFLLCLFTVNGRNFQVTQLLLPGFISLSHLIIDLIKLYAQQPHSRRPWFFADQLMHVIILFAAAHYSGYLPLSPAIFQQKNFLIFALAFLLNLKPASVIIKMLIAKWQPPAIGMPLADSRLVKETESLQNAGEWIGMLERSLVLLFVIIGHLEAVGFLLAAKSVFRFGDIKAAREMKLTEYVLIGTLLSFGFALHTGYAAALFFRL